MRVSTSYCLEPIVFQAYSVMQGPQNCDGKQAPKWVGEVLKNNPAIEAIAVNTNKNGIVYFRLKELKNETKNKD